MEYSICIRTLGTAGEKYEKLIKSISANELLIFEETSVDKCLPKLLIKYNLDCFVMNGIYPKRVLCHLNGNHINKYTHIAIKYVYT